MIQMASALCPYVIPMSQTVHKVRFNPKMGFENEEIKLKATIKTIAALAILAYSAPAIAGGVSIYDNGVSKLKLETTVFSKLTTDTVKKTGKGDKTTQGASIDRAYVTLKYNYNSDWMMRITTDVVLTDAANSAGTIVKKNNNIFLKYAYLQGKLYGDAVVLRLGQSHTPWIDHEEHLMRHRYFSPVMIDTNGYDASSDLGIGLKGKIAGGLANYWVTYTNGAGYSHPGGLNNKLGNSMDVDAVIGFVPMAGLTIDFQYRNGYKGSKFDLPTAGQLAAQTKSRLGQVMVTYGVGDDFRIGVNYAQNKATPTVTNIAVTQDAYALWGWARFAGKFGAFGRYEHTKDDKVATSQLKKDHIGLGFEYFPVKHVTLALAYEYKKSQTGVVFSALNPIVKENRVGLWSEFVF